MELNSKNLSIIGVIVVLIMAYYWWGKGSDMPTDSSISNSSGDVVKETSTSKPSGTTQTKSTVTNSAIAKDGAYVINYKPAGFSPSMIEVPPGKSVRFVNNSGKAMRIGSTDSTNNPIYNAFNQSKTVGQGGVYEYTFTDKGNYSYRNINNPGDQGVVIVK